MNKRKPSMSCKLASVKHQLTKNGGVDISKGIEMNDIFQGLNEKQKRLVADIILSFLKEHADDLPNTYKKKYIEGGKENIESALIELADNFLSPYMNVDASDSGYSFFKKHGLSGSQYRLMNLLHRLMNFYVQKHYTVDEHMPRSLNSRNDIFPFETYSPSFSFSYADNNLSDRSKDLYPLDLWTVNGKPITKLEIIYFASNRMNGFLPLGAVKLNKANIRTMREFVERSNGSRNELQIDNMSMLYANGETTLKVLDAERNNVFKQKAFTQYSSVLSKHQAEEFSNDLFQFENEFDSTEKLLTDLKLNFGKQFTRILNSEK